MLPNSASSPVFGLVPFQNQPTFNWWMWLGSPESSGPQIDYIVLVIDSKG